MFNAKDARALSQRATVAPTTLLGIKTAIVESAEKGQYVTVVALPTHLRLTGEGTLPSAWDLSRLLKEARMDVWADALAQCYAAGYVTAPLREPDNAGYGRAQFIVAKIQVRWDSPRQPAAGALMMSGETAYQIAKVANVAMRWAQPLLIEVERIAAAGRNLHRVSDNSAATDASWERRLQYLRQLGFSVYLRSIGFKTELVFTW